jgi:hypothetical protein
MDYPAAIESVYQHVEDGHVDKATMACLRIARHLKDYFYAALFLREMNPNKKEIQRILYNETSHLKEDAQIFLWDKSLEHWLEERSLDFALGTSESGEDQNVLTAGIGEIDSELDHWERSIQDMAIPHGMGEFDTAAFTDRFVNEKALIRLRMKGLQTIKERVRTQCLNYAIRVERQLEAQQKTQSFLEQSQNDVNNYFKARSENVYAKLQKAAQLADSNDPEDLSLLLTQVRRATKAAADFFYPPLDQEIVCADGKKRVLGNDQYLNRLQEFIATRVAKSSSGDLLRAELDFLSVVARRLNKKASKGVHATVTLSEAKQGLLGLYLFLSNLCSYLDEDPPKK